MAPPVGSNARLEQLTAYLLWSDHQAKQDFCPSQMSSFALIPPLLYFGTTAHQRSFFIIRLTGPETIDAEIESILHPTPLEDPLFDAK